MKKTIEKPDGSKEVVEGTPEELAEYERKNGNLVKESSKKKRLLTDGLSLQELQDFLDEWKEKNPPRQEHHWYFTKSYPDWMVDWCQVRRPPCNPECYACNGRPWYGVTPPPCICFNGWCVQPVQVPQITYTVTNDSAGLPQGGGTMNVQTLADLGSTAVGTA